MRTAATTLALVLLMTAWQTRVQHMLDGARERAGDTHREWITNPFERRAEFAGRPIYLHLLDELAPQGRVRPAEQPLRYPSWIRDLVGPT
jgi:hypothetical protein